MSDKKTFKIIVTGSRNLDLDDELDFYNAFEKVICAYPEIEESNVVIVHGACKTGADRQALEYAWQKGYSEISYPADWKSHGKSAGPIRNKQMIEDHKDADLAIVFWTGIKQNSGTWNCFQHIKHHKIPYMMFWSQC